MTYNGNNTKQYNTKKEQTLYSQTVHNLVISAYGTTKPPINFLYSFKDTQMV